MLERVCICCMHQCFQAERGEVGHTDLAQVGNTDLAPPFVCRRYTFAPASFGGLSAVAGFCGFRPDADHVRPSPGSAIVFLHAFRCVYYGARIETNYGSTVSELRVMRTIACPRDCGGTRQRQRDCVQGE
jgi:hypothetical protein